MSAPTKALSIAIPFTLLSLGTPLRADAQDAEPRGRVGVPDGLHASEVVSAVLSTSFELRARASEVEAARAEVDRALLLFVPRVGVSASYTRLSPIDAPVLGVLAAPATQTPGLIAPGTPLVGVALSFPVILDQTAFRAQLAVPVTDYFLRVLPARDASEHGVLAAQAMVQVSESRLRLEAETLYWGWVRAELGIDVAERAEAQARAHVEDAQRLLSAGLVTRSDVARAEALRAQMEELVMTTGHARDAVRDRLRTIMHVEALPASIGESLASSEVHGVDLEAAVARALEARSEMTALREQLAALGAQRTLADAALYPRVDVVGEALLANPNARYVPQTERFDFTWAVGAQASWQLTEMLNVAPQQASLDARVASLEAQRETAREGIRAEVVDAHRALRDAASMITSREAQLASAQETLALAENVYREGRVTNLVVIDAQTLVARTSLDLLNARIDAHIAEARLARATEGQ